MHVSSQHAARQHSYISSTSASISFIPSYPPSVSFCYISLCLSLCLSLFFLEMSAQILSATSEKSTNRETALSGMLLCQHVLCTATSPELDR